MSGDLLSRSYKKFPNKFEVKQSLIEGTSIKSDEIVLFSITEICNCTYCCKSKR